MKTIQGTVRYEDIEGGVWIIDTGEEVYQLKDGPEELYQDGKNVKLQGQVRDDMMSFGMMGPIFEVESLE
jgi:hypothetical protein